MGADMIAVGYTVDTERHTGWNEEWFAEGLDSYTFDLDDARLLGPLLADWEHLFDGADEDEPDEPDGILYILRARVLEGVRLAVSPDRVAVGYPIPGTRYYFIVAGGLSWGDDPFEGFQDLAFALDFLDRFTDIRAWTPILGGGIVTT